MQIRGKIGFTFPKYGARIRTDLLVTYFADETSRHFRSKPYCSKK